MLVTAYTGVSTSDQSCVGFTNCARRRKAWLGSLDEHVDRASAAPPPAGQVPTHI